MATTSRKPKRLDVAPGVRATTGPHHVDDVDGFDIELILGMDRGRIVADQLTITRRPDGPPVTGEALRRMPVDRWVRNVVRAVTGTDGMDLSETDLLRMRVAGPVDDTLRAVALLYRYAYAVGEPPTEYVGRRLGKLPRSTAARWVARARRDGFLEPAEGPGKAGI